MCRIMDTEYLVKQHEKIRQQFRHDAIMREIKKREDKLFKDIHTSRFSTARNKTGIYYKSKEVFAYTCNYKTI